VVGPKLVSDGMEPVNGVDVPVLSQAQSPATMSLQMSIKDEFGNIISDTHKFTDPATNTPITLLIKDEQNGVVSNQLQEIGVNQGRFKATWTESRVGRYEILAKYKRYMKPLVVLKITPAVIHPPQNIVDNKVVVTTNTPSDVFLVYYHKKSDIDPTKKPMIAAFLHGGPGVLSVKVAWLPEQGQYRIRYSVNISGEYVMGLHELSTHIGRPGREVEGSPISFIAQLQATTKRKESRKSATISR